MTTWDPGGRLQMYLHMVAKVLYVQGKRSESTLKLIELMGGGQGTGNEESMCDDIGMRERFIEQGHLVSYWHSSFVESGMYHHQHSGLHSVSYFFVDGP